MVDRRFSSHSQLAQTRFSFQAAVGSFDTATDFVAFSENIRILLASSAGTPSLFGGVIQLVLSPNLFNRTLLKKLTLATGRFGHHGFGLSRFFIMF